MGHGHCQGTLNVRTTFCFFRTFRFFRSIFRTSAPLHSASPSLDASALFRFSAFSAFHFFHCSLIHCSFSHRSFIPLFLLSLSQFSIVLHFVYSSDHFLAEVSYFSFRIPC